MKQPPRLCRSAGSVRTLRRFVGVGLIFFVCAGCLGSGLTRALAEVSFRNDVMAVLSKAGCNAGPCHGNANGKGGFKLSLRGEDLLFDFEALTRDQFGRRVNLIEPDQSLLLLKPTTQVAHEGGRRFETNSADHRILRDWIARGAAQDVESAPRLTRLEVTPQERILVEPESAVQLSARAFFSDGTSRDVTGMAVYETAVPNAAISDVGRVTRTSFGETTVLVRYLDQQRPVRLAFVPARPEFRWEKAPAHNFIDRFVFAKLRAHRVNPSPLVEDGTFMRRAYLDLLGILPTADEAKAFVADRDRAKRRKLIDRLLERPEFADFWALKWADLLRVEERPLDQKGMQNFHHWLRQSLAVNKPLDQFVREIVSARGSTYINPPANFFRANRDPVARSTAVAQVFLGTRLQCAECHNHPFDRWTQDDYYDWAALFGRVQYKVLQNDRRDSNDGHEFKGEQIVYLARKGEVNNPRTEKPAVPRMLGEQKGLKPDLAEEMKGSGPGGSTRPVPRSRPAGLGDALTDLPVAPADELDRLADWIASPSNPYFARAQVNRIWFHLMGRGLVDPIDDFRATNPASHPELLESLAKDFVEHNFDVRHVIRRIMNSRAYQLSSEPNATNGDDEMNYSRALVRRLSAEQLLDSMHQALDVPGRFEGYPEGLRAAQLPGVQSIRPRRGRSGDADQFLSVFGKPPRLLTCECERSTEPTMSQAFQLISGRLLDALLKTRGNRLETLVESGKTDRERIEELYWTVLTRPPATVELEKAELHLASGDKRAALEDVAWALFNSKEFILRN